MFVRVDGEGLERKVFRKAQNGIKCEVWGMENKGSYKIIRIIIL
jgi:hypothetical protein